MADQTSPAELPVDGAELDFGSHYFRTGCGVPYERNEHWLGFFGDVAEGIVRDLEPRSVLDAGCASGLLVEQLRKRGVEASGIDVSEHAISEADESVAEHLSVASLSEPIGGRYDLVVCIEVVEHIPAAEAERAIANLCATTDRLLISTTPEDYGEATHVNVQPPEAWSAALAREGFFRDLERDFSYITPWAALYTRSQEPAAEIVRRYDRAWWRQRREVRALRRSLLEAERRQAELEEAGSERGDELRQQLAQRDEEILRLRDLLIGKDAELGTARGRLAELEEYSQRLTNVATRLQSGVPGIGTLFRVLRRLKGRRGRSGG